MASFTRPRGLDQVALDMLELRFPVERQVLRERVGHILLEDYEGTLIAADDLLARSAQEVFTTADEVLVGLSEGLRIGVLETPLGPPPQPGRQGLQDDAEAQAAAAGVTQDIDARGDQAGLAEQALATDTDAAEGEQREALQSRQRDVRYEPPESGPMNEGLEHTYPPLLDPSSNLDHKRG